MKVEITIDRQKKLPDGAVPALEKELLRRLDQNFNNCSLVIRRASSDGLTVLGGMDGDKKRVEEILQDTWESADDWCCEVEVQWLTWFILRILLWVKNKKCRTPNMQLLDAPMTGSLHV